MVNKGVLFVLLSFLLAGCNKWKKPTETQFFLDVIRESALDDQLSFSAGYITIEEFRFDGYREKGEDVSFQLSYNAGLKLDFDGSKRVHELGFDIPQGVYEEISLNLRTVASNPALYLEGTYIYNSGSTIPFRFLFEEGLTFEVEAEALNGGRIILDKDEISHAEILLAPRNWFGPVPKSYFENADITNIQGTSIILIDQEHNEDIYDMVLDRLEEESIVVFK